MSYKTVHAPHSCQKIEKVHLFHQEAQEDPLLFVFVHGAGETLHTWSLCIESLLKLSKKYSVLAYDVRGHGKTSVDMDYDWSLETLSNDLLQIIASMYPNGAPPIILVGHSMGGAIAVAAGLKGNFKKLVGVVVIDIVEGSALNSLRYIKNLLSARPKSFSSIQDAIHWSLSNGYIKNRASALLSVPAKLIQKGNDYYWRTDLLPSEQFWTEWYTGLSEKFLKIKGGRLLILGGTEKLDTPLTIGQMQGKFQLSLFPEASHCIQEDVPEQVAKVLDGFAKYNHIVPIKKVPIQP